MAERIFYVDLFEKTNSNFYWLNAFRKLGVVQHFDIRSKKERLESIILDFAPTHIHLGGSVKPGRSVDARMLRRVKDELNCGVSAFYGDRPYSEYHLRLARVAADYVYISNKTHVKQNIEKCVFNCAYLPCPTEPSIFKYCPSEQIYDVVFPGWNNDPSRRRILGAIHEKFNLSVAGPNWAGTQFKSLSPAFGEDFAKLCGQTKIMLSLIGDEWRHLEGYFSNRLPNVLASRCFLIQTYSNGLEDLFTNHKHLVWYKSDQKLFAMIDYYLKHPKEREEVAKSGQEEVLAHYTFTHHTKKIIEECRVATQSR